MPERSTLSGLATDAFVERTPIDWAALRARVNGPRDRALVENLRTLAAIRDAAPSHAPDADARQWSAGAWIVVVLASLEITASLAALAVGWIRGAALADRWPQVVLTLAFTSASLLLAAVPGREPGRLFLIATFLSSAVGLARSALPGSSSWSTVLAVCPVEAFAPACLWQFAIEFPRVRRFAPFDMRARLVAAGVWIVATVLFVSSGAAVFTGPDAAVALLSRGHAGRLFWQLFGVMVVPAIAIIFVRARRAPMAERRRVTRFAAALAAGSAPFHISGLTWAMGLQAAGARHSDLLDWVAIGSLAASPLLASLAVAANGSAGRQGPAHRALLLILDRVRWRSARRSAYDERLAIALDRLRFCRGAREILATLAAEIGRAIDSDRVRMLAMESDGTFVDPLGGTMRLSVDSAILDLLREAAKPLDLSRRGRLRDLLPRSEREWLAADGIELLASVERRDGSIAAVIAVGRKSGGARFTRRERSLVAALAAAASAVWEDRIADRSGGEAGELTLECERCGIVGASAPLPCRCGGRVAIAGLPLRLGEKFLVTRRLGAGGMGVVYLARDLALGRDVALKTLPELRPDAGARLQAEARAMATLNHEALATIYGLELWQRTPVLVVEYFPRGTLADRLASGPIAAAEAVRMGGRLARALAYMHAHRLLHRDLKPNNIGLTASGEIKLLDFGLVTLIQHLAHHDQVAARHTTFAGTPAYLPPEAFRDAPPLPAIDLWALAVTLFEAITGSNPFAASSRRTMRRLDAAHLVHICTDRLGATSPLLPFFERAFAADPDARFRDASEMASQLDAVAAVIAPG
jgi:hypothetical protein